MTTADALLPLALSAAVPIEIADLAPVTDAGRVALARRCADVIAAHGDDLQYGGKHCKETFAALVKGLAAGAYQPGGIRFAGTLWCATHHPFGSRDEWCQGCLDTVPPKPEPERPQIETAHTAGDRL